MVKSFVRRVLVVLGIVLVLVLAGCEGLKSFGHTEFQEAVSDSNIIVMNEENTTTVKGNK
jgi:hypothetical protein